MFYVKHGIASSAELSSSELDNVGLFKIDIFDLNLIFHFRMFDSPKHFSPIEMTKSSVLFSRSWLVKWDTIKSLIFQKGEKSIHRIQSDFDIGLHSFTN